MVLTQYKYNLRMRDDLVTRSMTLVKPKNILITNSLYQTHDEFDITKIELRSSPEMPWRRPNWLGAYMSFSIKLSSIWIRQFFQEFYRKEQRKGIKLQLFLSCSLPLK